MKFAFFIAAALMVGTTPAFAALSGFYDSAEQIQTILSDSDVADALRQAPIGYVSNTGTRDDGAREWTIRTQDCDLVVFLTPVPPQGVGKTTYTLDFTDTCD
ncbi:hypothetical protein [Devosia epidermidihirudinis]|uniref:hypothetical protein n=1 Tax=Devosia epidermidihirudinis TaxID=1293439 RepID=UPI000A9DEB34|nr:hypothetical protein [Devosia epidermidihirudinis]